jgi:hypothetical protein
MSILVGEDGKQLTLWESREDALRVIALQLLGCWTARLHDGGRGWLLVDAAGQRYDQNGSIDARTTAHKAVWPVPLLEREMSRDGDLGSVQISFDNATGVRARVDSHLMIRGGRKFEATVFCPALSTNASIGDARDLAFSLLVAAIEAEKLLGVSGGNAPNYF